MCVKLSDDSVVRYTIENVKEVFFEDNDNIIPDSTVVDASATPLKFRITSDSTAVVTKDDSYRDLESISIPAKVRINGKVYDVTSIEYDAFSGCSGLTNISIPEGVSSIGYKAFSGCSSLTSIKIPESVSSIGEEAFSGCSGLTSINIPEGVTSIGYSAFRDCRSLTSINIPEGVSSIDGWAFYGCSGLTSINIPESVTDIDSAAFAGCSSLSKITIPKKVTYIGDFAFYGCNGLTDINIPEGVTFIGYSAFSGCSGLTSIQIPSSVIAIYELAFYRCINLDVTIDNFEGNVNLGFGAFEACKSVTYLKNKDLTVIDTSDTPLKFRITSDSTAEVTKDYSYRELDSISIPAKVRIEGKVYDVTSIYDNAFSGCSRLTRINIPEGVTRIDSATFASCSRLTSINIPEGVTSIRDYAFSGCSSLTSINIPEGVSFIGRYAFSNCKNLDVTIDNFEGNVNLGFGVFEACKSVTYLKNKDLTVIDTSDTPLKFIITSDSTAEVTYNYYDSYRNLDSIFIPAKVRIDGKVYDVTSIGDGAFYGCSKLTSINIPEGVSSIGHEAFSGCSKLKSINIPESVTFISDSAFVYCDNLDPKLLIYNNGTNCYGWVGSKDSCINVVIPSGVKSIGDNAFSGCSKLTSISIPESVTSIGEFAFYGCSGLTNISIPEGVTSIGYSAFRDCRSLTSINIPEGVSYIGGYAFYGCTNLDVTIDNSENNVKVGNNAFYKCKSVTYLK